MSWRTVFMTMALTTVSTVIASGTVTTVTMRARAANTASVDETGCRF